VAIRVKVMGHRQVRGVILVMSCKSQKAFYVVYVGEKPLEKVS